MKEPSISRISRGSAGSHTKQATEYLIPTLLLVARGATSQQVAGSSVLDWQRRTRRDRRLRENKCQNRSHTNARRTSRYRRIARPLVASARAAFRPVECGTSICTSAGLSGGRHIFRFERFFDYPNPARRKGTPHTGYRFFASPNRPNLSRILFAAAHHRFHRTRRARLLVELCLSIKFLFFLRPIILAAASYVVTRHRRAFLSYLAMGSRIPPSHTQHGDSGLFRSSDCCQSRDNDGLSRTDVGL